MAGLTAAEKRRLRKAGASDRTLAEVADLLDRWPEQDRTMLIDNVIRGLGDAASRGRRGRKASR